MLAQHQFMMCPEGHGVQAPKLVEALLMGYIPICTRNAASVALKKKSVPILLIESWSEISQSFLSSKVENLAP